MFFRTLQKRLSELVEAVDGQLDPTVTSDLNTLGLCRVVWLLSRQKPQVCVSRLRCEDYGELNTRLHQRHVQLLQTSADVAAALNAIKAEAILSESFVAALAEAQGWEDEWMTLQEPKSRGRGPKAVASEMQRAAAGNHLIPDMMKAASQAAGAVPVRPPAAPGPVSQPLTVAAPPPVPGSLAPRPPVPLAVAVAAAPKAPPVPVVLAAAPKVMPDDAATVIEPEGSATDGPVGTPDAVAAAGDEAAANDMEVTETSVEHAAEVAEAGSPGPMCAICRNPLRSGGREVQMLACGHVWHKTCLENSWTIGDHEPGWCPYRCDVRRAAAELELPAPASEVEEAAPVEEGETPMEPVTPSPVPAGGGAASMVL
eukprot:s167_g16.t1